MEWLDYPHYARNKIIKSLENQKKQTKNNNTIEQQDIASFVEYPMQGQTLIKNLSKNVKRQLDKPFQLRNIYSTKKLTYHLYTKEKVPEYLKSHKVYEFSCQPHDNKYIEKIDQSSAICWKNKLKF